MAAKWRTGWRSQFNTGKRTAQKRIGYGISNVGQSNSYPKSPKKLAVLKEVDSGWRSKSSRLLKIHRSCLYKTHTKQAELDKESVQKLLAVHERNPYYGVARFALALGWSEHKARRIRNLSGIVVYKRRKKHYFKPEPVEITAPANALKTYIEYRNPNNPYAGASFRKMTKINAWSQDFTYLNFKGVWVYVATVLDLPTRRILGWSLGLRHNAVLVHKAVTEALSRYPSPKILHDDQGSEYLSYMMREICAKHNITLSCSDKGSPWQNGFKERFYKTFKDELGYVNRFKNLAELYAGIAKTIYYYNNERIHTALKMSPNAYARELDNGNILRDNLSLIMGG